MATNTFLAQSDFKQTVHHTDKLRVAAYIRVSTDSDDQENSFEVQKAYFEETLSKNNQWISAGVFADYGLSGTQKKSRDGLNRLIRRCIEGKIDRILCKSISRLARNTADFIKTLDTLHDCGVSIYFEKENIDTTDAVSSFVITALAALAQEESLSISENVKWGNEKRFPAGEVPNHLMYGYRYCKGADEYTVTESGYRFRQIEIVPEEAEVVKRIFTEIARGKKYVDVARGLNADRIPPPDHYRRRETDKGWCGRDIGNIIRSERYVGDVLIQKTITIDPLNHKTIKNDGEAPQYLIHNHHPAIIDRGLYNVVQAVRDRNRHSRGSDKIGKKRRKLGLTGLLKCPYCGRNYNSNRANRVLVWFCPDAEIYKGIKRCKGEKIEEERVIMLIKRAFFLRFGKYNFIKLLTETLQNIQSEMTIERKTDELIKKKSNSESRIKTLEAKLNIINTTSKLYEILHTELGYQKEMNRKAEKELERLSELQISASRHYDLRNELLQLLNTESEKDILAVLFDKYARAIINSITVVSAVELKIKWLDDSVTEIRREF